MCVFVYVCVSIHHLAINFSGPTKLQTSPHWPIWSSVSVPSSCTVQQEFIPGSSFLILCFIHAIQLVLCSKILMVMPLHPMGAILQCSPLTKIGNQMVTNLKKIGNQMVTNPHNHHPNPRPPPYIFF